MNIKVFGHDKKGKLVVAEASQVKTYAEAIAMLKTQIDSPRAMCVVQDNDFVTETTANE